MTSQAARTSSSVLAFRIANGAFLVLLCALTLYPFVHVASVAFSSYAEAIRVGLHLFPREVDLSALEQVVTAREIWTAYYNTLWRTIIGTALSVLVTGMGAYALSKHTLPLRRTIMAVFLFTMYFSGGVIPTFLLLRSLGLLNTRWSMVLPSLVWGFNIIVMRNFFLSIPESFEESAQMDGASPLRVFFQIVVPLSGPVLATIAMWMGVFHWNAYFDNLIYITDKRKYVLQRMIRSLIIDANMAEYQSMNDASVLSPESLKAATILVATIPILLVYPFAQKYFIKGVMIGGVKG
jgi:putative aldouronate transport system permease protein